MTEIKDHKVETFEGVPRLNEFYVASGLGVLATKEGYRVLPGMETAADYLANKALDLQDEPGQESS
jgi:hypothetical protein